LRIIFFLASILRSDNTKKFRWKHILTTFAGFLLPLHKTVKKKPVYTFLRYLFHICLVIVPVFLSGHIVLWEMSWLELSWPSIPDGWADWMTIIFIALSVFFLLRHLFFSSLRRDSKLADYFLILSGLATFLSGYLLAHDTLASISLLNDNLYALHILCGETLLITAVFLFLRSRLDKKKCTGCAACESECPTGTLKSKDQGAERIFVYSHYLCISCGACINACPENAAQLRHNLNLKRFFQIFTKQTIRTVKLKECERCGKLFAPVPQLDKVNELITDEHIYHCPSCKKINSAQTFRSLIPWLKKPQS